MPQRWFRKHTAASLSHRPARQTALQTDGLPDRQPAAGLEPRQGRGGRCGKGGQTAPRCPEVHLCSGSQETGSAAWTPEAPPGPPRGPGPPLPGPPRGPCPFPQGHPGDPAPLPQGQHRGHDNLPTCFLSFVRLYIPSQHSMADFGVYLSKSPPSCLTSTFWTPLCTHWGHGHAPHHVSQGNHGTTPSSHACIHNSLLEASPMPS